MSSFQPTVTYPLQVNASGYTAVTTSPVASAEQRILELLFTNPGERLNRPTLGCGLVELLFEGASDELLATVQFQVTSSLQQWLGDILRVVSVQVTGHGGELDLTIAYQLLTDPAVQTLSVSL